MQLQVRRRSRVPLCAHCGRPPLPACPCAAAVSHAQPGRAPALLASPPPAPCSVEVVLLPDGTEALVGCGEHCLNRLSFIHCDPRTCPCGLHCSNKPFHQLKVGPAAWRCARGSVLAHAAAALCRSSSNILAPTYALLRSTLQAPALDVFLTDNRGHGVRVNSPLPAGSFVVEYAGEVRGGNPAAAAATLSSGGNPAAVAATLSACCACA